MTLQCAINLIVVLIDERQHIIRFHLENAIQYPLKVKGHISECIFSRSGTYKTIFGPGPSVCVLWYLILGIIRISLRKDLAQVWEKQSLCIAVEILRHGNEFEIVCTSNFIPNSLDDIDRAFGIEEEKVLIELIA